MNCELRGQGLERRWLAGPHGLRIDRTGERVLISPIFRWFGEDWGRANAKAAPVPGTHDYDWSLNRQ